MGNSLRGIVKVDLVIKEKHARLNNDSCFQVLSNKKKRDGRENKMLGNMQRGTDSLSLVGR